MTSTAVVPHTGEIVDLASTSSGDLAGLMLEVREVESRLRELKQQVSAELHDRMDRERAWTLRDGEYKITGKSDAPVVSWDVTALQAELDEMVAEGVVTAEAVARAVVPKVEYRVAASGINALLKSPALAERLSAHRTAAPPADRRVSITKGAA